MDTKSGAHKASTPYKSCNRINKLLVNNKVQAEYGKGKLQETPVNIYDKLNEREQNEGTSSVRTSITMATTVYEYSQCSSNKT